MVLIDHRESAAKYHECIDCHRIPELDPTVLDHRLTSLLWAHLAAAETTTARTGEATTVLPAPSAPRRGREEPAGSDPLRVDPEAGPQADPKGRPTSGGKPQWRLNDTAVTDGGERE